MTALDEFSKRSGSYFVNHDVGVGVQFVESGSY